VTTQNNTELHALTGVWNLDPERTSVAFRTRAAWVIRAKGTLRAVEGTISIDAAGNVTGTFTIDPASIASGIGKRDDHLRTPDFFDVAKYPAITFTATGARRRQPGHFEVTGQLEVHGRTTPITLLAEVDITGDSAALTTTLPVGKDILGMKKANLTKSQVSVNARFHRS
jgi:polyisoprenoid-binding protein YceI